MQLSREVKNVIWQCPKLNIYDVMYRNVSFLNTLPNIPHNFQFIKPCMY